MLFKHYINMNQAKKKQKKDRCDKCLKRKTRSHSFSPETLHQTTPNKQIKFERNYHSEHKKINQPITYKFESSPPKIPLLKPIITISLLLLLPLFYKQYTAKQLTVTRLQSSQFSLQQQVRICRQEYIQNRCDEPLPAVVDYCNIRKECFTKNILNDVEYLGIALNVFAQGVRDIFNTIGVLGILILLIIIYILRSGQTRKAELTFPRNKAPLQKLIPK